MSDVPYAMMDLFLSVESYQMSTALYNNYIERIHAIDAETIMQTAQKYLKWEEMSVISAG